MTAKQLKAMLMGVWVRHKLSIIDLGALIALLGVAAYIAFSVDIFANEQGVPEKTLSIELDEVMLLGVLLLVGLLIFAMRRYRHKSARQSGA